MNNDHWPTGSSPAVPTLTISAPSHFKTWVERTAIAIVSAVAILVPLTIGLLLYLAITDGIVINADDPLHEKRMWLIHERTGATGIGLTLSTPRTGNATTQCAMTSVIFLQWDKRLRIESDASYCRCYEIQNGLPAESSAISCQP